MVSSRPVVRELWTTGLKMCNGFPLVLTPVTHPVGMLINASEIGIHREYPSHELHPTSLLVGRPGPYGFRFLEEVTTPTLFDKEGPPHRACGAHRLHHVRVCRHIPLFDHLIHFRRNHRFLLVPPRERHFLVWRLQGKEPFHVSRRRSRCLSGPPVRLFIERYASVRFHFDNPGGRRSQVDVREDLLENVSVALSSQVSAKDGAIPSLQSCDYIHRIGVYYHRQVSGGFLNCKTHSCSFRPEGGS
mmetsp:Transcript_70426/g.146693  ORF Transcript_70426/g.146693 Transcript_70426/m.146693 type:complete len:245 (-) Transcript_70426:14-748(-)